MDKIKKIIIIIVIILVSVVIYAGMKYRVNGGVVEDQSTGLTWTRCSMMSGGVVDQTVNCTDAHQVYEWGDAINACENLDYEGVNTWRLPNSKELQSIVTYKYEEKPTIDESVFPNTNIDKHYWTSTVYVENGVPDYDVVYTVHFEWGNVVIQFVDPFFNHHSYVRCVTGP